MSPTTPPKADKKEIVNPSRERTDNKDMLGLAQEARGSKSVDEADPRIVGDSTNRVSFALPTPSTTGEISSIKETPMAVATIHAIELTASRR